MKKKLGKLKRMITDQNDRMSKNVELENGVKKLSRKERIDLLGYSYDEQPKERVTECNLCGSTHLITVSRQDRYGYNVRCAVCAECGLGFLSPRMTKEGYSHFYENVYRPLLSAFHGYVIDKQSLQEEDEQYAEYVWELLEPYITQKTNQTLIDVGGSTGIVLKRIESNLPEGNTINFTVLDPSPDELEVAKGFGFETELGLLEEFEPKERTWDIVLLCRTVDHLHDINASLQRIKSFLKDDGYFFIDIVDWEFTRNWSKKLEMTIKVDHPFLLTRSTMIAFLEKNGFKIISELISPNNVQIAFLCQKSESQGLENVSINLQEYALKTIEQIREIQVHQKINKKRKGS